MQDAHIALFDRLVALEPEEATALGREDQAHALRDLSESGEAARRDFWRDALALGGVEPADSSAAERLEHRTLERHARLELVRCVAIGVGDDHEIAREEVALSATRQVEAFVVTDLRDPGEDEIARLRQARGRETAHRLERNATGRVGA